MFSCSLKQKGQEIRNVVYIDNADYDFGLIPDSISLLKHSFILYNKTNDTCVIKNIEKSCGCTKVYSEKMKIEPYDSTRLHVQVDIGNNYNFFEKDINVYTSILNEPITIYVRASRKMPVYVMKQQFPYSVSDDIRLSSDFLFLGFVERGKISSKSINIINLSDKGVKLKGVLKGLSSNVIVECPKEMDANEISRIVAVFDLTNDSISWGTQNGVFFLQDENCEYPIKVQAIVTERFDRKKKENPRIFMPVTCYQIDDNDYKKGYVNKNFQIKNYGTSDLIIRNVQILKGEKVEIKLFDKVVKRDSLGILGINACLDNMKREIEVGITTNDMIEPYKIVKLIY